MINMKTGISELEKTKLQGNIACALSLGGVCLLYVMHRFELAPSLAPPYVKLALFCTLAVILFGWGVAAIFYARILEALGGKGQSENDGPDGR